MKWSIFLVFFSVLIATSAVRAQGASPTPAISPSPTPAISPSPTPAISPSPTPVVSPSPSPTVGISAVPVVVVGYGDGARGYDWLEVAILLFGFTLVIGILLYGVVLR